MASTPTFRTRRVVVVGAGMGGLAAALDLAAQGLDVTLVERATTPGGKMRQVTLGGAKLDAGPTVFTMRWVFDSLFANAGASLADHLTLHPAATLARHAWGPNERLDLFADIDRSADAIATFATPADARGFRAFCAQSRAVYDALERPFIRAARPTPLSLVRGAGLRGLAGLWRIKPFETLWHALGQHLADPRLRQLFGRYATYCGSSPFLAPATLMLVAHVERDGVWLVEGGMHQLAAALAGLAAARGAALRYETEAAEITVHAGRASGVRLASGERLDADAVVVNADPAALAAGLLGPAAQAAGPAVPRASRSLSAVTWAMLADTDGFPLVRHNVFFSRDYAAEFDDLLRRGALPANPTVYVCAQDRGDADAPTSPAPPPGPERLLCLVNAPPLGDARPHPQSEIDQCAERSFGLLQRCGLCVRPTTAGQAVTTPADFNRLFPATGGALYGAAVHGPWASFRRPGARTALPGLYLAGGGTHPGAGVPMAALSGRLAAASLLHDLAPASASTRRSRPAATPGGTSTP